MDSQHRHELKENELFEFFHHFREWWNKNGTSTLLIILLAVAAVVGWRWYSGREERKLEAAWSSFAATLSPESRQQVAQAYADVAGVSNYALLRAGDQLLFEAVAGSLDTPGIDPASTTLTDEQKRKIEQAIGLYQQVTELPQATEPSLYVLNARMGLAAGYETLGQFDKAREQYNLIREEAGVYRSHAQMATSRVGELDELAQPILFQPAPPEEAAEEEAAAEETDAPAEATEPAVTPSP